MVSRYLLEFPGNVLTIELGTLLVAGANGPSVLATIPLLRVMQPTAMAILFIAMTLASTATVKSPNTMLNSPQLKCDTTCLIGRIFATFHVPTPPYFLFRLFMGPGAMKVT